MAGAIRRYASTAWNNALPNSLAEFIIAETNRHRLLRFGSSRSRSRGLPEPEVCTGAGRVPLVMRGFKVSGTSAICIESRRILSGLGL